jgi:hypothetical protein
MTLRTERYNPASNPESTTDSTMNSTSARASRSDPSHSPIAFDFRPSLGERIVAAARVAAAMHLTGAALIAADEAALRALESRAPTREPTR